MNIIKKYISNFAQVLIYLNIFNKIIEDKVVLSFKNIKNYFHLYIYNYMQKIF